MGPVDLDSLNAKLLAKEYKAAGKGVKSKDPLVKAEALGKLSNVRYYTEGGVLLPLVEQAVPKKVRFLRRWRRRSCRWAYLPTHLSASLFL